ncbi:hypothetical protein HF086_005015 [Spodoptera exigua]|uniref:Integrator complex subunit 4 n=1 Tax=Spodoptera exigua TaxID=7107 RepID=A0A922MM73_SPOEX|nr:hypothetical protein HF086_005015 [Spodoptera exigua]
MAAVLKKRALAEYNKVFQDGPATKKLHLVKKPLIGSSAAAFVGLLEKCKSSDEALQLLLRISDCLQFQESDVEEAIKKLSEHFQSEEEAVVRVKILWLFCDIAQGIATLLKLGSKLSDDKILMMRLVAVAKDNLKDTSHQVKCRCLQLISELYPIYPESERTTEMAAEADAIVKLLGDYSHAEDARVRCEAFQSLLTMHERGQTLSASLYDLVCVALSDDYEIVREVALKLVWVLGNKYPENTITLCDGETTMRLVDDAFVRICSAVNDLCMQVRALACTLLGTTRAVSDRFLLQTLDKQLMSNMKKKRTAHERGAELVRSEVRTAAVDAVCQLSMENAVFATTSLDFLVDMFNDEIEDDYSMDVREGLHRMLGSCTVASKTCLEMCIDKILENLKRYPQVTMKIYSSISLLKFYLFIHVCTDPGPERGAALPHDAAPLRGAYHQALHLPARYHAASRALSTYRLAEMEPAVSGAAVFTRVFARCVRGLHARAALSAHALTQLSTDCLRLQHQFSGVSEQENACVWQLALRVSAAKLCAAAAQPPGSAPAGAAPAGPPALSGAAAALSAAAALTHHAELLDRLLASAGVEPDPFTIAVFRQLSMNADHKPAALARAIMPLLQSAPLPVIPAPNIKVYKPAADNDTVVRFSAGLVAGVALEAEVLRVRCPGQIRVRVAYPDTRVHALVPHKDHLRPLDHQNTNDDGTQNVRLLTKVLISHGVWTEPCGVDISVCLAVEEGGAREPAQLIELCRPVRVTVAPKPIKRGI